MLWLAGLALLALLAALPFAALVTIGLSPAGDAANVWPHLLENVLPRSALATIGLLGGVAVCTAIIGGGTAWLVSLTAFPFRRTLEWALVLPLAIPTYLAAYGWVEIMDYTGPVQGLLRFWSGATSARDYAFPEIRSLAGAVFIFSLVLYPYVYLPARLVFSRSGASVLDAARSLGASPVRLFWRIGMPLARPAIAAGVLLALMESLNDIGAVEILGVRTLTYAVFETWLNRGSLSGAVQLSLLLLAVVVALVLLERATRRGRDYAAAARERPPARQRLRGGKAGMALAACITPILLGFVVPLSPFVVFALRRTEGVLDPALWSAAGNSVLVSALTALLACAVAYGVLQRARLGGSVRTKGSATMTLLGRLLTLGYAVPGTVLAIGLLVPLAGFDNALDALLRSAFGISSGLLVSGSVVIVIYACTLRFLAVGYGTVETGFARISPSVDMAARTLGRSAMGLAHAVHRPMLMPALAAAGLLVFVDTMKELSATLLLRPFGFSTLATHIYERASAAALEDAAPAALLICLIGLVPILALTRVGFGSSRRR